MKLKSSTLASAQRCDIAETAVIKVSIIVPVYNEAQAIEHTLKPLQRWRGQGLEVIVVDGGSEDQTACVAKPWVDHYLYSVAGRARQMNVGAAEATGDYLLFLHGDTLLPDTFFDDFTDHSSAALRWGFFPVRLSGRHWLLRWVERGMNWRSRFTGVATGDQAMWLTSSLWRQSGGFKDIKLMEDVELSKRLRKLARPHVACEPLCTSSRRWESHGVVSTVFLMWRLRLMYFLGVNPNALARRYRPQNST